MINKPWIPQHDARKYILETEPLSDFQYLLESGINELKTEEIETSNTTNVLTFHNEHTHLYDNYEDYSNTNYIPSLNISNHDNNSLNKQILETYKQQRMSCF